MTSEIEYTKFAYNKPIIAKCPECKLFGERVIRTKGNNKYLYYYHKNNSRNIGVKTCYIGKIE